MASVYPRSFTTNNFLHQSDEAFEGYIILV